MNPIFGHSKILENSLIQVFDTEHIIFKLSILPYKETEDNFFDLLIKQKGVQVYIPKVLEPKNSTKFYASQKGSVKFPYPQRCPTLKGIKASGFPSTNQKKLLSIFNSIPIYTIANNYNEIILASPREAKNSSVLYSLIKQYQKNFVWQNDIGSINLGLFFTSKADAELLVNEIKSSSKDRVKETDLSVKCISLREAYQIYKTSPLGIQFRFIPDLQVLRFSIKNYKNLPNLTISNKHHINKHECSGTPLYKINKNWLQSLKLNSSKHYEKSRINQFLNKELIFFSYYDLIKFWKLLQSELGDLNLSNNPKIILHNLENLIMELENTLNEPNIKIFPLFKSYKESKESKMHTRKNFDNSFLNLLDEKSSSKITLIRNMLKKIIWLLTSNTKPNNW